MDYHHHIVTSFSPLLDLLIEPEQPDERIVRLIEAIQAGELYIEVSPMTINSAIRYIELKYPSLNEQKRLTSELLDWVRVNSEHGIEYHNILEEANDLRPYPESLAFEDIVNLVFAKEIGGGSVYLTNEPVVIQKFIVDRNLDLEYQDLQIFDLESLAEWLDNDSLFSYFRDFITVRTPAGNEVELRIDLKTKQYPTPVDFAYQLHTGIGHRCQGALIDGQQVNLDTPLRNGQVVQIIERPQGEAPDRHWLTFVSTKKAREKIRKWLKNQRISEGKKILKLEFGDQYSFNGQTYRQVSERLNCRNSLELFEKLGERSIDIEQVKRKIEIIRQNQGFGNFSFSPSESATTNPILGVDSSQMIILCTCCLPFPSDSDIVGITKDKEQKLLVHRQDCSTLTDINAEDKQAFQWSCESCTVAVQVKMRNRPNILTVVDNKLTEMFGQNVIISDLKAHRNPVILTFYILCNQKSQLDELKIQLEQTSPDVLEIRWKGLYPGRTKFDKAIAPP